MYTHFFFFGLDIFVEPLCSSVLLNTGKMLKPSNQIVSDFISIAVFIPCSLSISPTPCSLINTLLSSFSDLVSLLTS